MVGSRVSGARPDKPSFSTNTSNEGLQDRHELQSFLSYLQRGRHSSPLSVQVPTTRPLQPRLEAATSRIPISGDGTEKTLGDQRHSSAKPARPRERYRAVGPSSSLRRSSGCCPPAPRGHPISPTKKPARAQPGPLPRLLSRSP